ncbi:alanyl-tRNA synthetase [Thiohalorhabdus denitrificans]|uniref:Alanine--tRNA ligase n=1 Tax=Thiohalorhabdus denitrificans TaxID=381306 RepID=A0A0P9GKB9_9GAMM|nr:alanine--tRNA ligase [Thiohalorhabdus denitrificans]KPV40570.1 alanyl-tRNA synthetase [Thiohalorhabdus denitrificans]SCY50923.1 alanyl-tRNA synthetase [Thiohalorhabdus denitrificans]
MEGAEIRRRFLEFFAARDHEVVPSASLVPQNDPTLLFTNAGMVQFKDVFLGREHRDYNRAVTSQRCLRAGGKHNDLENVGHTARHHTFFEMLGNFSFGDYFKREAIQYAWAFLTEDLGLPEEKLFVTVYTEDEEAARIWLDEMGIDSARFAYVGAEDNFWSMGDTGPCGPCSEIFYDHGPELPGSPPGSGEDEGDRYVEIWNLVFMQYNRDAEGNLHDLPKPNIDTGMGLERIAAVMEGVHNNFDTDLFLPLIHKAAELAGVRYNDADATDVSLRVIADHIRACSFLITDGVIPSNEGRGYVLRRIIRRAARHGRMLGIEGSFFHQLVQPLVDAMGHHFTELDEQQATIERVLRIEEERFAATLSDGLAHLEEVVRNLSEGAREIPGEAAFRLYDTYGFPLDLTEDIARERGLSVDTAGFDEHMAEQKARARASWGGSGEERVPQAYYDLLESHQGTEFLGYQSLSAEAALTGILKDDACFQELNAGEEAVLVLNQTPFYGESGGQVGDTGRITTAEAEFVVTDTQLPLPGLVAHVGRLERGRLKTGETVHCTVDESARHATAYNHSATHLLHGALRRQVGEHVRQMGSLVEPERLRFDFSHYEGLTPDQLRTIENEVNRHIRANYEVSADWMTLDQAQAKGAIAFFDEKYGEQVRVITMGPASMELCGGTHVSRTGNISLFKIVEETGIAAGVRRITALTGQEALNYVQGQEDQIGRIAGLLKGTRADADERVAELVERSRDLEKEVERLKSKLATAASGDLLDRVQEVGGTKVLAAALEGQDPKSLRQTVDQLKQKLGSGVIVLGVPDPEKGKVSLIAGVTDDLTDRFSAGDLVNRVAEGVGGKGGGRADMAQAGGKDPENLEAALERVPEYVESCLAT